MTAPAPVIASADNPTFRRLRALVDEPREVKKQGRTVLMVTHDPTAAACAKRRVIIKDGRIT